MATSSPMSYSINMDPVTRSAHDGTALGGYGKSNRNVSASFVRNDNIGTVTFEVQFGKHKDFNRGLTKIAYESLAYFLGPEVALEARHQATREYLLSNRGKRRVLMKSCSDKKFRNQVWAPHTKNGEYTVSIRLALVEFLVDLSEDQALMAELTAATSNTLADDVWTTIPPDA